MFLRNRRWLAGFVLCAFIGAVSFLLANPSIRSEAQAQGYSSFIEDMRFLKENAEATLFFNPFGTNPDPRFEKHRMNSATIYEICAGSCEKMGMNFANFFGDEGNWGRMREYDMGYFLQIVGQNGLGATAQTIRDRAGGEGHGVIVRFGVGDDVFGVDENPQSMVNFLRQLGNSVEGATFYAIAGPNEPDLEPWAHGCGTAPASDASEASKQEWYTCAAPKLANYMNAVCDAKNNGTIPANVQLLTPAFNGTSYTFTPLTTQMQQAGARFSDPCFSGLAINIYPAGNSVVNIWDINQFDRFGKPVFVTETGPWTTLLDDDGNPLPVDGQRENPYAVGEPDDDGDTDNYHYISPILGLYPPAARDVGVIRDSLANQGYQAYCATPTYTIEPRFGGDIEDFIDNVRAGYYGTRDVEVGSTEIVDYTDAKTPIFRSTERKHFLKSDLEEFFGYREIEEDNYSQTELKSGAVTSLLSDNQKCMKTVDALLAQEEMCNKLAISPELNCALYYTTVPGTNTDIRTLLGQYKAFAAGKSEEEACHQIVSREEGAGVSEEFYNAMMNAALHFEEAYRIAFLVGVVEQKPRNENMIFNFFSHSEEAQPRDEVVVFAFKIPDIGTNKGGVWQTETVTNAEGEALYERVVRNETGRKMEQQDSAHTFFDEAFNLVRNILIPRKQAEKLDIEGSEKRVELREAAAGATSQNASSLVYCLNGQAPYGQGSAACNDESTKAVVDIINGTWNYDKEQVSCDQLTSENVDTIGDSARLGGAVDNYKFQFEYGEFILGQLWAINGVAQPFQSVFPVNDRTYPPQDCVVLGQGEGSTGDCTTLTFYLVYPVGYDMDTLEYVLARTFLTEEQFEKAKDDPDIKNRFNIFDDRRRLESEEAVEEFQERRLSHCDIDELTGRVDCPDKEFTAEVTSSQGPALFWGARLGYWTREIQKSFNRMESLAHKYLRTCRSTEEFLLDQCGGVPEDQVFDDPAYCEARPDRSRIVRDVGNDDLDRFAFYEQGNVPDTDDDDTQLEDDQNEFFPEENEIGCSVKASVRAIDGLTLFLSGGTDIVPNNPGNILGCVGRVSVAQRMKITRLPPEYQAERKAANPDWKPDQNDPAWATGQVLQTKGSSASEIHYDFRLRKGYYKVEIKIGNTICTSDTTWVMKDGDEQGGEAYVYDFTDPTQCSAGACFDMNLQTNMEGGGPVFGPDEDDDGEPDLLYTIDEANEWHEDSFGCSLSFTYSTLTFNNTCGGGRAGSCGDTLIGGNCGFWSDMVNKIRNGGTIDYQGETLGGQRGTDAYRSVFGRLPDASGDMSCTHARWGNPIFGNTIVIRDCENYTSSLDSLRVFGKIVGFTLDNWFLGNPEVQFEVPNRELWSAVQTASKKHGCDPWLVLALASSEGGEPGYFNDTRPNNANTIGMFEFGPDIWADWTRENNSNDAQCTWLQPPTFTEENYRGVNFSDRGNVAAQVDTACRIALYTGMQKYPDNEEGFTNAFTQQKNPNYGAQNNYSMGWFNDARQAQYVYSFWQKARESAEEAPLPQPTGYPYEFCRNGEQPSRPPAEPTKPDIQVGEPNDPANKTAPAPGSSVDEWIEYWDWYGWTTLPKISTNNTYMNKTILEEVRYNRQNGVTSYIPELSKEAVYNCELDFSGNNPEAILQSIQNQAANNGFTRAIGCAASVRIGDSPFNALGRTKGEPHEVRTVWVKPKNGYFANRVLGPIAIIDTASKNDLEKIYNEKGPGYLLDINEDLFKFIHYNYGAWDGPQDLIVCNTKEECENLVFP